MTKENNIKYDVEHLDSLINSLKQEYYLRVGILGSKAKGKHDNKSGLTNADLGSIHEFGSDDDKHPPRRSFLEDSLKYRLKFNEEQMKQFRKSLFKNIFQRTKPNVQMFLQELGAKCLQIIEEGFATNGFGKWRPLIFETFKERSEKAYKNYNRIERAMLRGKIEYDRNTLDNYIKEIHNPNILTDTGKLRHSMSFKVDKKK